MNDLATFLLARIAEDAAWARAAVKTDRKHSPAHEYQVHYEWARLHWRHRVSIMRRCVGTSATFPTRQTSKMCLVMAFPA